jgi:hypothetical protein
MSVFWVRSKVAWAVPTIEAISFKFASGELEGGSFFDRFMLSLHSSQIESPSIAIASPHEAQSIPRLTTIALSISHFLEYLDTSGNGMQRTRAGTRALI